eukprot:s2655_g7.t1
MSWPLPEDWVEDADYLDARRSIGNLACPRHVVSSPWARDKDVAGTPVANLHPAHFLYQGWNRHWLRWIAQGKEVYFVVARTKPEMVLVGEVLTQIRNPALDIDAAATNHAVQTQASQAKTLAVKALAQHLVDCLRQKIRTRNRKLASASWRVSWATINNNSSDKRTRLEHLQAAPCCRERVFPLHLQAAVTLRTQDLLLLQHWAAALQTPLSSPLHLQPLDRFTDSSRWLSAQAPVPSMSRLHYAALLQPPQEGSNWLAANLPNKFQVREIKTWINSLTLNERKKNELQEWLKQVETWLEARTDFH